MGFCMQTLDRDGLRDSSAGVKNIHTGWTWLVLRRDPNLRQGEMGLERQWHIQGNASDEAAAVEMCVDENYLIGPIPIDSPLPTERMEWVGSYFPLQSDPTTQAKR